MRTVRVKWEGPLSLDELKELADRDKDWGLYQIYGRHIIFGAVLLLYIGKTKATFSKRVKENYDDWKPGTPWYQDIEVSVRIGRLYCKSDRGFMRLQKDDSEFSELLCDVEAFQIFCHSPPYNGDHISSYNGQPLIIENVDKLGDLFDRLSTYELTDSGVKGSEVTEYLLEVIQVDREAGTCQSLQSDVFLDANKNIYFVGLQASNKIRDEELRDLFEKQRWSTSGEVSHKVVFLSENKYVMLSIKTISKNKQMELLLDESAVE